MFINIFAYKTEHIVAKRLSAQLLFMINVVLNALVSFTNYFPGRLGHRNLLLLLLKCGKLIQIIY